MDSPKLGFTLPIFFSHLGQGTLEGQRVGKVACPGEMTGFWFPRRPLQKCEVIVKENLLNVVLLHGIVDPDGSSLHLQLDGIDDNGATELDKEFSGNDFAA